MLLLRCDSIVALDVGQAARMLHRIERASMCSPPLIIDHPAQVGVVRSKRGGKRRPILSVRLIDIQYLIYSPFTFKVPFSIRERNILRISNHLSIHFKEKS